MMTPTKTATQDVATPSNASAPVYGCIVLSGQPDPYNIALDLIRRWTHPHQLSFLFPEPVEHTDSGATDPGDIYNLVSAPVQVLADNPGFGEQLSTAAPTLRIVVGNGIEMVYWRGGEVVERFPCKRSGDLPAPGGEPSANFQAGGDMKAHDFWRLMKDTHARSGGDTHRQAMLLIAELATLGPDGVLAYERTFRRFVWQAYDRHYSPGSAFSRITISYDGLEYFIGGIIGAGEDVYYGVLGASSPGEIEAVRDECGWGEQIGYVPQYAYYRATGRPHPDFDEGDYHDGDPFVTGEDRPEADAPAPDGPACGTGAV